jgi:hypothetical protein
VVLETVATVYRDATQSLREESFSGRRKKRDFQQNKEMKWWWWGGEAGFLFFQLFYEYGFEN